jgi:hypothetical protein
MQANPAIAVKEFREQEHPDHCSWLRTETKQDPLVSPPLRGSIQEILCLMLLEVVCLIDGESEPDREDPHGKDSSTTAEP